MNTYKIKYQSGKTVTVDFTHWNQEEAAEWLTSQVFDKNAIIIEGESE